MRLPFGNQHTLSVQIGDRFTYSVVPGDVFVVTEVDASNDSILAQNNSSGSIWTIGFDEYFRECNMLPVSSEEQAEFLFEGSFYGDRAMAQLRCECGVDSVGGDMHSAYCPKYVGGKV